MKSKIFIYPNGITAQSSAFLLDFAGLFKKENFIFIDDKEESSSFAAIRAKISKNDRVFIALSPSSPNFSKNYLEISKKLEKEKITFENGAEFAAKAAMAKAKELLFGLDLIESSADLIESGADLIESSTAKNSANAAINGIATAREREREREREQTPRRDLNVDSIESKSKKAAKNSLPPLFVLVYSDFAKDKHYGFLGAELLKKGARVLFLCSREASLKRALKDIENYGFNAQNKEQREKYFSNIKDCLLCGKLDLVKSDKQEVARFVPHEEEALRRNSVVSDSEPLISCNAVGTGAAMAFAQGGTNHSGAVEFNKHRGLGLALYYQYDFLEFCDFASCFCLNGGYKNTPNSAKKCFIGHAIIDYKNYDLNKSFENMQFCCVAGADFMPNKSQILSLQKEQKFLKIGYLGYDEIAAQVPQITDLQSYLAQKDSICFAPYDVGEIEKMRPFIASALEKYRVIFRYRYEWQNAYEPILGTLREHKNYFEDRENGFSKQSYLRSFVLVCAKTTAKQSFPLLSLAPSLMFSHENENSGHGTPNKNLGVKFSDFLSDYIETNSTKGLDYPLARIMTREEDLIESPRQEAAKITKNANFAPMAQVKSKENPLSVVGGGGLRGEGSDFAIQAPSPLKKKNKKSDLAQKNKSTDSIEINAFLALVEQLSKERKIWAERILDFRANNIYNFGNASRVLADELMRLFG